MAPGKFINKNHQEEFDEKGYIVLSALSNETINKLKSIYDIYFITDDNPRSNFNAISAQERNTAIKNEIIALLADSWTAIFSDYINHGATFFTKTKSQGELGPHQDSTIVDTKGHFACYTWIPLHTVTEENGCMFVIEGSHLFYDNYISFTYKNQNIPISAIHSACLHKLEMKPGEVLFYHNRLFHGSYINQTNNIRVAVNTLVTAKDAPLVYYQKKDDTTASQYMVTADSLLNSYPTYSKGLLPDGAVFMKDFSYRHIDITPKMINDFCSPTSDNNKKSGIAGLIKRYFHFLN